MEVDSGMELRERTSKHTNLKHVLSSGGSVFSQAGIALLLTSSAAAWNVICRKIRMKELHWNLFMAPF